MRVDKKIGAVVCLLVVLCSAAFAQKKENTLLRVGDEAVTLDEFRYLYQKNNANSPSAWTKENLEEYLALYIKFKLKVVEAKAQGMDTLKAFKEEFAGYKKQLAKPYLTERNTTDRLVREAYERLGQEIRASHLLIEVGEYATPSDTLKAFEQISRLRQRIVAGEDFERIALKFSYDPSVNKNKGDLGYFTAMQMVYPFESEAYRTQVGQVSNVFRTRFGYHILKVTDKRPSRGSLKVAHIMVRAGEGISAEDSLAFYEKAIEIEKQLKTEKKDWHELVTQFSDDYRTRNKGGELPWFTSGNMIPAFENAAFALQNEGDISAPVKTPYGWHIIKLLEKKPLESFDNLKPTLTQKISKDSRAALQQKFFIARLKKENKFEESKRANALITSQIDTLLTKGRWKMNKGNKDLDKWLFKIQDKAYSLRDFYRFVQKNQKPQSNFEAEVYIRVLYDEFVNQRLMAFEEAQLEDKYPEFRYLAKEYYEGILLFKIMDGNVWTKALSDEAGLKNFHTENSNKYLYQERAKAQVFNAQNADILQGVQEDLKNDLFQVTEQGLPVRLIYDKGLVEPQDSPKELENIRTWLKQHEEYLLQLEVYPAKKESKEIAQERIEKLKSSFNIEPERVVLKEVDKALSKEVIVLLRLVSRSAKVLEKKYNVDNPLSLQVEEGLFEKGKSKLLDQTDWKSGTYHLENDGRKQYIVIQNILSPSPKPLDKIRGTVISDYQKYLETTWLTSLEKKYKVHVDKTLLKRLVKK